MSARASEPACPLCGSATAAAFETSDRNRSVSERAFHYRRCLGCQVLYLADPPADLAPYYAGGYHAIPTADELAANSRRESYKVDVLRSRLASGTVVDIGPSYGGFPYLAREAGYEVTAIEVDPDCCAFIESAIGARAIHSDAPESVLPELGELDAVTLWHSIEHLGQPWMTVEAAVRALRPGGVLIVATPNPDGVEARTLRGRWFHVDAPRHLFLIGPAALASRATAVGLRAVQVTSTDEETRRCNLIGWQRAVGELGLSGPAATYGGAAVGRLARIAENRFDRASAYLSVFVKP